MYSILYHEKIVDDLLSIQKREKEQIKKAIEKKLTTKPLLFGEPLRSTLAGYRKLRVGNYCIVYNVLEKKIVIIIIVAHRRHVYDFVKKRSQE